MNNFKLRNYNNTHIDITLNSFKMIMEETFNKLLIHKYVELNGNAMRFYVKYINNVKR